MGVSAAVLAATRVRHCDRAADHPSRRSDGHSWRSPTGSPWCGLVDWPRPPYDVRGPGSVRWEWRRCWLLSARSSPRRPWPLACLGGETVVLGITVRRASWPRWPGWRSSLSRGTCCSAFPTAVSRPGPAEAPSRAGYVAAVGSGLVLVITDRPVSVLAGAVVVVGHRRVCFAGSAQLLRPMLRAVTGSVCNGWGSGRCSLPTWPWSRLSSISWSAGPARSVRWRPGPRCSCRSA